MLSCAIVVSGTGEVLVTVLSVPTLVGAPTIQGKVDNKILRAGMVHHHLDWDERSLDCFL